MDTVDNLEVTETDTATAQPEVTQEVENQDTATAPETSEQEETQTQPTQTDPYKPFSGGKEKFKVNGKEYEWDWETTKRYAQLGRSGQLALEKAAATEKKARAFYDQLVTHAAKDPDGLIETLTGRKRAPRAEAIDSAASPSEIDPKDAKIHELEERLSRFEKRDEETEIQRERQAIQAELDAACKKYPELNDDIVKDYVKSQYRKHLNSLNDGDEPLELEDIAFQVAQQIRERSAKKSQEQKKRLAEKRRLSPISSSGIPAGGSGGEKKPESFEDIKRLAGMI